MTGQDELVLPVLAAGLAGAAGLVAVMAWLRRHLAVIEVYGSSMEPSLHAGDRVLVRRASLPRIRAGDIIVYHDPDQDLDADVREDGLPRGRNLSSRLWTIKRAAAVPGDLVPAVVAPVVAAAPGARVPAGCLAVLGDNMDHSYDSRDCGYITAAQLLGVVKRRI